MTGNKLILFLGSGISLASKLPSVAEIRAELLKINDNFKLHNFLKSLHDTGWMVMSGYGWQDLPLNFQLQNWLAKKEQNRLVILHRRPKILAENSLELRQVYNFFTRRKQVIPIKKWLSETSIFEIIKFFQ